MAEKSLIKSDTSSSAKSDQKRELFIFETTFAYSQNQDSIDQGIDLVRPGEKMGWIKYNLF